MKNNFKTKLAAILCGIMCLSLCACENDPETDSPETVTSSAAGNEVQESKTEKSDSEDITDEEAADGAESEHEDESEDADESAEASTEFKIPIQEDFSAVDGLSDSYADLENRAFAYNGTVFTLGKSTLRDLIDGGIPFDESDLNNKGNNVNENYKTGRYTAKINDYVTMQFTFINITDGTQTEEECLLSYVRYSYLYVPQPDYDEDMNAKVADCIIDASKKVCFSFPATLTKEQLLENSSVGAEEDGNNVNYEIDSEIYMGSSGYNFTFNKTTNQMQQMSMTWLP